MKTKKKIIAVLLMMVTLSSMIPIAQNVSAAGTKDDPVHINIGTVSANGPGYAFASNLLTINEGGYYTITGSTNTRSVAVGTTSPAIINLDNVGISLSGAASPINLGTNANVTLELVGSNTLRAGHGNYAGIRTTGANLTVQGTGNLTVNGGTNAAGIGGNNGENGGRTTIKDGTITSVSINGAGIGGGAANGPGLVGGSGGTININGGNEIPHLLQAFYTRGRLGIYHGNGAAFEAQPFG